MFPILVWWVLSEMLLSVSWALKYTGPVFICCGPHSLEVHKAYCRGTGCNEWSMAAEESSCVTARAACSGSRLGSVRMAVLVLRRRSELRTTEETGKEKRHRSEHLDGQQVLPQDVMDSLGLRTGRAQCWSNQDRVDRHRSSTLAVETIPL